VLSVDVRQHFLLVDPVHFVEYRKKLGIEAFEEVLAFGQAVATAKFHHHRRGDERDLLFFRDEFLAGLEQLRFSLASKYPAGEERFRLFQMPARPRRHNARLKQPLSPDPVELPFPGHPGRLRTVFMTLML
jgi:hypothetical protein